MSNNTNWSMNDLKKKKLIEVNGQYVPASSQVAKGNVEKLPTLMERAQIYQNQITETNLKIAIAINKAPANKKIKNATKSVIDGVKFDSNLERFMYELLKTAEIEFEFQKVFLLQDKFKYRTENIRSITKVCDFWLPTRSVIIDTKGYENDVSPMKHKMLKMALKRDYNIEPEIMMPKNKQECYLVLNKLLYGSQN
ncbi:MAG: Phage-related protein [Segetibacter sp.]|nr:Phage-related protein [Segetibacter sp.]